MAIDKQYKEFIHRLAEGGIDRTFLNSDEDHALNVLTEIIKHSEKTLRIFAGCLCPHIGNQEDYIIALSNFIERGGEVFILLNDYNPDIAKESDLYKRLAYYVSKNFPIHIKSSLAHPYLTVDPEKKKVHFTIGDDKSYRIETDIDKRTAECNFNNPILASHIIEFYDDLFNDENAKPIDITTLFAV